jgi:hypothetical protein
MQGVIKLLMFTVLAPNPCAKHYNRFCTVIAIRVHQDSHFSLGAGSESPLKYLILDSPPLNHGKNEINVGENYKIASFLKQILRPSPQPFQVSNGGQAYQEVVRVQTYQKRHS